MRRRRRRYGREHGPMWRDVSPHGVTKSIHQTSPILHGKEAPRTEASNSHADHPLFQRLGGWGKGACGATEYPCSHPVSNIRNTPVRRAMGSGKGIVICCQIVRPLLEVSAVGLRSGCANDMDASREYH
eukprot:gene11973-biopygen22934